MAATSASYQLLSCWVQGAKPTGDKRGASPPPGALYQPRESLRSGSAAAVRRALAPRAQPAQLWSQPSIYAKCISVTIFEAVVWSPFLHCFFQTSLRVACDTHT